MSVNLKFDRSSMFILFFIFSTSLSIPLEAFVFSENVCLQNRAEEYHNIMYNKPVDQCSKGIEFRSWRFTNCSTLNNRFPIDPEVHSYVRKVSNVLFSVVKPTPLNNVKLVAGSDDVLANILNLNPNVQVDSTFVEFVAGNWLHPNGVYLSHRYGGHQVIKSDFTISYV